MASPDNDSQNTFRDAYAAHQQRRRERGKRPAGRINRIKDWWDPHPATEANDLGSNNNAGTIRYRVRNLRPIPRRLWDALTVAFHYGVRHPVPALLLLALLAVLFLAQVVWGALVKPA